MDEENELFIRILQEDERNENILKALKEIKELVFYTDDIGIEDVKGIIRELEDEIGEI